MALSFEVLDQASTPIGELCLRRRRSPAFDEPVYEVKLDDAFLMSSMFTDGEIALAELPLARLSGVELNVVVGGLGLGHTACAALEHHDVANVVVIEALEPVIEWHRRALVPLGARLYGDRRCRFVHGDFFARLNEPSGIDPGAPGRRFDAILVDIDHSPRVWLNPRNATFYAPDGLRRVAGNLRAGGVFALWSNDPPDDAFIDVLANVFSHTEARVVRFHNPLQQRDAANTVYIATKDGSDAG